nr:hypothetical protein [Tanacetum cinerariifolium]
MSQSILTTKASPKSQLYLDDLEIGVTGFMFVMNKDEFHILMNAPFIVEFDGETSVHKASVKSNGFIRYPFELVDLENLEVTNNKYLIDVIGYVTNVSRTIQQRSETRTLDFYLANSSVFPLNDFIDIKTTNEIMSSVPQISVNSFL